MTTRGVSRRLRARLRDDERGFSLLEVIISITVIFGALTALVYTASVGFSYVGFARERQGATGLATEMMERVRGLAYERIQQGLLTDNVAADTGRVVTGCTGDEVGVYRFESCSGEKIVHSTAITAGPDDPLVPHLGTAPGYPTPYEYGVYVTNDDPSTNPYRLTVIVTWDSNRFPTLANEVRTQSLSYSPSGCVSASTHPFQAPCQPFFFGQALAPKSEITITGTVDGVGAFDTLVLEEGSAEANIQVEQVAQIQSTATTSAVARTVGSDVTTAGSMAVNQAADNDPSTATTEYASDMTLGSAGSLSVGSGSNVLSVSNGGGGDVGRATSAAAASATSACPLAATESDEQPCGHATIQRQNAATATLTLGDAADVNLGTATLARLGVPGGVTTAFSDRELGVGGEDGRLEQSVNRVFGTVNLGGLPSGVSAPANWSGAAAWKGYLVSLVDYSDTANAQAGTSAPIFEPTRSGTIYYWDASIGDFQSVAVSAAGAIDTSVSVGQVVDGKNVTVTISASLAPAANVVSSSPTGAGSITRNEVRAEAGAPLAGTVTYAVTVDGSTVASLTLAVNLANSVARGTYEPAPTPTGG